MSEMENRIVVPPEMLDQFGSPVRASREESQIIEKVNIQFPAQLPGVELWNVKNSSRLWTVYHMSYEFSCVDTFHGYPDWYYRGKYHSMGPNSVMIMEPGEFHRTTSFRGERTGNFHVVSIDSSIIAKAFSGLEIRPNLHFNKGNLDDPKTVLALRDFYNTVEACNGEGDPLDIETRLYRFIWLVFERGGEQAPAIFARGCARVVNRATEYLRDNYHQKVRLDELSDVAGVSKYYLLRSFSQQVGLTPHSFQLGIRIAHAREMLKKCHAASEVANAVGFCDLPAMTRAFKQSVGFTPGKYRR
jgi:AraC-like DNA-binding protein